VNSTETKQRKKKVRHDGGIHPKGGERVTQGTGITLVLSDGEEKQGDSGGNVVLFKM